LNEILSLPAIVARLEAEAAPIEIPRGPFRILR